MRRLHAHRLAGKPFPAAVDVVRWLGAVQSQDYAGAKWAVGQRSRDITDGELDRLFDRGDILRTHVLRPTWHFVLPEDIRWMLGLTGPRVRAALAGRHRQLELDPETVVRASSEFARALSDGHYLTRAQLGERLREAGISPEGQRLPHLLMCAELEGLIVSGPRHGKEFTYGLLDELVPKGIGQDRDRAVAELTRRYFRSRGPAQVQDFVWWSGLTSADARRGIAILGAELERQVIEGSEYWFDAEADIHGNGAGAQLLPNFDEYTVAYRHRGAAIDPGQPFDPQIFSYGSILSNVVVVRGRVLGAWRRTVSRQVIRVEMRLLGSLTSTERSAIEAAGRRFGRFLDRPIEIVTRA